MTGRLTGVLLGALLSSAAATGALAHHATMLPVDQITEVGGTMAVCTGIGLDARDDPRWSDFPLRVEIAGEGGQYLGDAIVGIKGPGIENELTLRCRGPWVLVDLPAGRYQVSVQAGHDGPMRTAMVNVGETQRRMVMHFPNLGGERTQQIFAGGYPSEPGTP